MTNCCDKVIVERKELVSVVQYMKILRVIKRISREKIVKPRFHYTLSD